MIILRNANEIDQMRDACKISAQALLIAKKYMHKGVSTKEIDDAIAREIASCGAKASFLGYGGFPASACISVNNQVIHGIPSSKILLDDGDIVSVDVGAFYNDYHGDNAFTYAVGEISDDAKLLLKVTNECLYKGIEQAKIGNRIGDISNAVETHARKYNFGVVKTYVGHGVGKSLHEDPEIPNYGKAGRGVRLAKGMTIAIEPMINLVGDGVTTQSDGWTVLTNSGSISAHFEHSIFISEDGPKILTQV
ncbi:MAG: type I methionyl aminopeptidase [Oscillospiraceae bacterium]